MKQTKVMKEAQLDKIENSASLKKSATKSSVLKTEDSFKQKWLA